MQVREDFRAPGREIETDDAVRAGERHEQLGIMERQCRRVRADEEGGQADGRTGGQINDADGRARIEGTAGVQLVKDAVVFDDADRHRIRTSLLEYEQAAVTEWTEVANGRSYPEADKALSRLSSAYDQVQASTDAQKARLAASYSNLGKLSQARAERVMQARTDIGPPWSLWAVIFLTSGLLLGGAIIYGVEKPATHYTMVAILGVLVAAQLFLVLELSHPFIGEIATSPQPLHEVIQVLTSNPA